MEILQNPHRGFSCLVFDLLPNSSIDHLVAVILNYPRREEMGRRKGLNPWSNRLALYRTSYLDFGERLV
jgi:hypothetical protein